MITGLFRGNAFPARGQIRRFNEAENVREPEDPGTQDDKRKGREGGERAAVLVLRIQAAYRLRQYG